MIRRVITRFAHISWIVTMLTVRAYGDSNDARVWIQTEIVRISKLYRVNPRVVEAVAEVESGLNPAAVSGKGAIGVMQIMPATGAALNAGDLRSARRNIEAGVRYLRYLGSTFGGDLRLALAAYNAGPGAVLKYRGIPPYMETRAYVTAVIERYEALASPAQVTDNRNGACGLAAVERDSTRRIIVRARKRLPCSNERVR